MKLQRLLILLTPINLALVLFALGQVQAAAESSPSVLRSRALEIVDATDRVRASITVLPADPSFKMPDGTIGYSETVLLRLVNSIMSSPLAPSRCTIRAAFSYTSCARSAI